MGSILLLVGMSYGQITISGSIGANGTYTSLTNAAGAFAAINGTVQTGAIITISITADVTTEAGTNALNSGAWTSLSINPSGVRTISGAVTGHLIDFNGASNVTINGLNAGGNSLVLSNTAIGASSTVRFTNDASNNTITNCVLQGSSTSFGVIYFGTGTVTGNDNNVVSNCSIAPAGSNLPLNGVYSMGSSSIIDNSNITISGNNIYDFFSSTLASNGMNINSFNSAWTITNNKLYQSFSKNYSTANTHCGIFITSGSGYTITGNTIGYASAGGTGTYVMTSTVATRFIGFNLAVGTTTATTSIQGNTVTAISLATSSGASTTYGILCGFNITSGNVNMGNVTPNIIGGASGTNLLSAVPTTTGGMVVGINTSSTGTILIQNNVIGGFYSSGTTAAVAGAVCGIDVSGVAASMTITGNTIGNTTANSMQAGTLTTTGSSFAAGIYLPSTSTTATITNNTIQNLTSYGTGASGYVRGIFTAASSAAIATLNINSNTIFNLTSNNTNASISNGNAGGVGINLGTGSVTSVSNNTIYNISLTNTGTGGYFAAGITLANATSPLVSNNKIYNITNASTSVTATAPGIAAGVIVRSATTAAIVVNNMISLGNGQTSNTAFIGIQCNHGSSPNPNDYIYYNTINIEGTAAAGAMPSFCFYRGDFSTTARTMTVDIRDNILSNTRSGGTGKHYAIANNYGASAVSAVGWSANASNYNVLNGNIATIGYWGADRTFSDWKTVSLSDANSLSAVSTPFVSTAAGNLHLNFGLTPTQIESGGVAIAGITTDIDGQTRPGPVPSVNGAGLFPDIGADEFDAVLLDLNPPVITYTPVPNTASTSVRTLVATITDVSGVASGVNKPVLYWKINSAATYTGPVSPISISGSSYTYTFGSGVVTGDFVSYFIVAQDISSNNNVGSYPAGATVTANPPLASAGPPAPSIYSILYLLCGSKTVGTVGADYPTITAALADLNSKELCGPLTLTLLDASYATETLPLVINANPGSSLTNTVKIKPAIGISTTISGASASGPVFKILNSNTTVDGSNTVGGTTKDIIVANTSATSPSVFVIGSTGTTPITGVTVKNCTIINGANTATAVTISDGIVAGTVGYFNNITIQNNSIQKAYIGIYAIANMAAGNGSGLMITGNDLSTSGANSIRLVGLYVQGVDGCTLSNNLIGNIANTLDAANLTGIWLATGTINANLTGNTISAISGTLTSPRGIAVSSAVSGSNVTISDNVISSMTSIISQVSYGIYFFSTTSGCIIQRNKISDIKNTNSGGYSAIAIALGSTLTDANTTVQNNFIWDVAGYGYASTTTDNGYGINILSGGGYRLYYNSVNLATDQTSTTGVPAALIINSLVTTANSLDIRNNIFSITSAIGTNRYSVLCNAANTVFSFLNYNDYYSTGPNLGYIGADRLDLAAWQTGTGKDANSVSGSPSYVSNTNLHILFSAVTPVSNSGNTIAGVTTDIDGDTRTSTPDMGADEYTYISSTVVDPTAVAANAIHSTKINLSFVPNVSTNDVVIVWSLTNTFTAPSGTPTVGGPLAGGIVLSIGTSSPVSHTGLTPLVPYYYMVYSYNGYFYSPGVAVTATPMVAPPAAFTATPVSSTQINLAYSLNAQSNNVVIATAPTSTFGAPVNGTPLVVNNTIAGGGTVIYVGPLAAFNHTSLTMNTAYYYAIWSYDAFNYYSNPGVTANATTQCILPSITGTAPGSRCGTGTVVLGATSSAGTINWYSTPTLGTSLGTGTSFTTPILSANTTYYVDANNSGCITSTRTAVLATVTEIPTITGTTAGSRCGTGTVVLNATSSAGTVYWYSVSTNGTSLGSGSPFTTPVISSNTTYWVDATLNGCTSGSRTSVLASVNALPANPLISSASTNLTCLSPSILLTASSTTPGVSYSWSSGGTLATTTVVNQGTYTVTISIPATGCYAAPSIVITKDPSLPTSPSIAAPTTILTCSTTSIILTASAIDNSPPANLTYSWSGGGTTATKSVSAPGTYFVTITDPDNGCSTNTSILISQNIAAPSSIVINSSAAALTCATTSILLTASATDNSGLSNLTYLWSGGGTGTTKTITTVGTYVITVTDPDNGCSNTGSKVITQSITGPTSAVINSPTTVITCSVPSIVLTASATDPYLASNLTYLWSTTATTVAITVTIPGTYTVTITDPDNGCSSVASVLITQPIGLPAAPVSGGDQINCQVPIQTIVATATPPTGSSVVWFDAATLGNIVASPSLSALGTVNYWAASMFISTGCYSLTRTKVTLNIVLPVGTPTPISVSSGTEPSCQINTNSTTTTYGTTAIGSTGFNWTTNNPAAGTIGASTGVMAWTNGFSGTVQIQAIALGCNGPSSMVTRTVIVKPPIGQTSFFVGPVSTRCQGAGTETYSASAANTSNIVYTISPTGLNTINSATGLVTWNAAFSGTAVITATASGCYGPTTATHTVTVTAWTIPTFTAGVSSVCVPSAGNVYSTQTGMNNYSWTVSAGGTITSGSGSSSITVTWNTAGPQTVTVSYLNTYWCSAPTSGVYTVNAYSHPVSTLSGPASMCVGSAGNVYTTEAGMSAYSWVVSAGGTITAGGNSSSNTVTVTWTTAGSKTVSVNYSNANGCTTTSTAVVPVTVNALPVPTITGPNAMCIGTAGNVYTTQSGMSNYIWTVSPGGTVTAGGNSSSNTVTVTWNTTGAKTVTATYTNLNACVASSPASYAVTVNALPIPVITGPSTMCAGTTGSVYVTQAGMSNYSWSISGGGTIVAGGTSASNTVTVNWVTPGSQSVHVNYTNANACTGAVPAGYNVTVNSLPVPTLSGPAIVCSGAAANVYTTQAGMTAYSWIVSPGGTITSGGTSASNSVTVTWSSTGAKTVIVNYVNANSCTSANPAVFNVLVNTLPTPSITGPSSFCGPQAGNTYTTQPGMSNYSWNVSTGGTITAGGTASSNTITINWTTLGNHSLGVTYSDPNGCAAPVAANFNVSVNPVVVPSISGPYSVCATIPGNVYSTQAGMSNYSWWVSPGGIITAGGTSSSNTITITWGFNGAGSVRVSYINQFGCQVSQSPYYPVTIISAPEPIISGLNTICAGIQNVVYSTASGMSNYVWTISEGGVVTAGGTSTSNSVAITWLTSGSKTVSVNYANSQGCSAANPTIFPVYVNPTVLPVISGSSMVCKGLSSNTYSTQANMSNYVWGISPGGVIIAGGSATSNSLVIVWTTNGPQWVKVSFMNGNCQSDVITYPVIVNPRPTANAGSNVIINQGDSAQLNGSSTGGTPPYNFMWSPAATLSNSLIANPLASPASSTAYQLLVTDNAGCMSTDDMVVEIQSAYPGINGVISYDNTNSSLIDSALVTLRDGAGSVIQTTHSDLNGHYIFTGLLPGAYNVSATPNWPWGGVNSEDALRIIFHYNHIILLTGVKEKAADVNGDNAINSIDALMVVKRFVMQILSFPVGDWACEANPINVNTTMVVNNFKVLCYGDVTGSYNPPSVKHEPSVSLTVADNLEVSSGTEFEVPIKADGTLSVGAISLVIHFPANLMEIKGVEMNNSDNLVYNVLNGEVRISWYNTNPEVFTNNTILTLKIKAGDLFGITNDMLELNLDGESEISNNHSITIQNVNLTYPRLLIASNDYSLANYPNPFDKESEIIYTLPEDGTVTLKVYNLMGEQIALLVDNSDQKASTYKIRLDGSNMVPGIYTCMIEVTGKSRNFVKTTKMVISR